MVWSLDMSAFSTWFGRYWRTIIFILGLVLIIWFIWALREVFMPFVIGFILAYLLLPMIRWVEKRFAVVGKKQKHKQLIRVSIILVVYLLSLAVVGLLIFYIIGLVAVASSTSTN